MLFRHLCTEQNSENSLRSQLLMNDIISAKVTIDDDLDQVILDSVEKFGSVFLIEKHINYMIKSA